MHEKIADAFERLIAFIMIALIMLIFAAGLTMLGSGLAAGIMMVFVGLPIIIMMFGVFSVFISIRRTLMSIDQQLRNRPM